VCAGEKGKIRKAGFNDDKGKQGDKAEHVLSLKRGWWAIRESSVQNLNTRLDKAIEPEMDKVRGGKAVDGGGNEWVRRR